MATSTCLRMAAQIIPKCRASASWAVKLADPDGMDSTRVSGHTLEGSHQSNNRAELIAVIAVIVEVCSAHDGCIYSDGLITCKGCWAIQQEKWPLMKLASRENFDLWLQLWDRRELLRKWHILNVTSHQDWNSLSCPDAKWRAYHNAQVDSFAKKSTGLAGLLLLVPCRLQPYKLSRNADGSFFWCILFIQTWLLAQLSQGQRNHRRCLLTSTLVRRPFNGYVYVFPFNSRWFHPALIRPHGLCRLHFRPFFKIICVIFTGFLTRLEPHRWSFIKLFVLDTGWHVPLSVASFQPAFGIAGDFSSDVASAFWCFLGSRDPAPCSGNAPTTCVRTAENLQTYSHKNFEGAWCPYTVGFRYLSAHCWC